MVFGYLQNLGQEKHPFAKTMGVLLYVKDSLNALKDQFCLVPTGLIGTAAAVFEQVKGDVVKYTLKF